MVILHTCDYNKARVVHKPDFENHFFPLLNSSNGFVNNLPVVFIFSHILESAEPSPSSALILSLFSRARPYIAPHLPRGWMTFSPRDGLILVLLFLTTQQTSRGKDKTRKRKPIDLFSFQHILLFDFHSSCDSNVSTHKCHPDISFIFNQELSSRDKDNMSTLWQLVSG